MDYLVEARSQKKKKFIEAILPSMVEQLGLINSKKSVLIRLEQDCQGMGYTVPVDILDSFVVVIKSSMSLKDVGLTLAHELVHVRQMARGILKIKNGVNYWRGKRYTKRVKYLNQPWEQDAFARQEMVLRRAIEE
jgi:hypothetical protein